MSLLLGESKMNIYRATLFGLTLFALAQATAQAEPSSRRTYSLSQQAQGTRIKVSIYERKSHHVVWSHSFPQCDSVTWSPNQRAVIFIAHYEEIKAQHVYPYRLVIWRAGIGSHIYNFYANEYTLLWPSGYYFLWSPHSEGILWRTGDAGAETYDEAELGCIDVRAGRNYTVAGNVYVAYWIKPKVVKYQQYSRPQPNPVPKDSQRPHQWHLPSKGSA